ncbi:hypothetical protein A0H81_12364 [Grifola frondosa]|uniref:Uncharacterized protein n=1 Tax=Grifola frondosa TaxID=5627 RepID=A0A1C7LS81_GRIFR|nr:hypothetical protein A0H81_12364 [Grifola frondosa]
MNLLCPVLSILGLCSFRRDGAKSWQTQLPSIVDYSKFSIMNPFGQGQWQQGTSGNVPSIFGALPSLPISSSAPRSMQPDSVTFQLMNFNSTILNCSIDNESRNVAMIQWQPNATLEIRGVSSRQRVREWLRLSSDQSRRIMEVKGIQYAWAPMDGFICLYRMQTTAPRVLARIARAPTMVLLELTQEAMQAGLLEPSLVATVMLVCGHNID